jgi:hypothetical protein
MKTAEKTEFQKFDAAVDTLMTVSREELQKREKKWKKQQERKKRAKSS